MGRSKPMRDAYYRSYANPHKQRKVNCHEVTIEMKNMGTFHCMDCERHVVHAGGRILTIGYLQKTPNMM